MALEPSWSREAMTAALRTHFGHPAFRPGQWEVLEQCLGGRNVVAVMPTGRGKSLCYQLPAVVLPRVTVVVSPLLSLMHEQVARLLARGIAAASLDSTSSDAEKERVWAALETGSLRLLYVSPERLQNEALQKGLARVGVSLFAVDEAHCISQWGHDFRPEYAELGAVRQALRPTLTLAVTATATTEVRHDIARVLRLLNPWHYAGGFNRPNLFFDVARVEHQKERVALARHLCTAHRSGIIYCATRKGADALTARLVRDGHQAVAYHAGLGAKERAEAHRRFEREDGCVAVATSAFGMGIDKASVRFVMHANMPASLESFYQEAGRAGRDGAEATSLLCFSNHDVWTQERLAGARIPPRWVLEGLWNTVRLAGGRPTSVDELAHQVGAERGVIRASLRVFERARLLERREDAMGVELKPATCREFAALHLNLRALVAQEARAARLLRAMVRYGTTRSCRRHALLHYFGEDSPPTCGACDVCTGTRTAERLKSSVEPTRPSSQSALFHASAVAEKLRRWRNDLAVDLGLPAYLIFNDATLFGIANALPTTREEFLRVKGAGDARWERFGAKIVEVCRLARAAGETPYENSS